MVRVAIIQMVSTPDVKANLLQAQTFIQEAVAKGAEFALLPEYFPLISDDETDKLDIASDSGSRSTS